MMDLYCFPFIIEKRILSRDVMIDTRATDSVVDYMLSIVFCTPSRLNPTVTARFYLLPILCFKAKNNLDMLRLRVGDRVINVKIFQVKLI